jgi:CheY-like chemotaxis protein
MHDSKILIVDDQRDHLKLIKAILEKLGWHADTVDSAEEALLILEWHQDYCAIITDLKIPWMNGIEFCKIVKKTYPQILVFALTGNPDLFNYRELNSAGFDGFYFKPISVEIIKNILIGIKDGVTDG